MIACQVIAIYVCKQLSITRELLNYIGYIFMLKNIFFTKTSYYLHMDLVMKYA
jgi:hypothetical protein